MTKLSTLPRDARDTLFLLGVIAVVVAPQTSYLPWWSSVLTAGVLAWRGVLAWQSRPLPTRPWLIGVILISLGATWLTHRTLLGREAGVTLIVMLLALKTLELRARRDAYVVFFLGFFTMLTSFFNSQSLLMAAGILLGLMGLLTALVNAHMPAGKPPLWLAAKTAARMALMGTPIMLALFVLFPRLGPLWGLPSDAMTGRSGLSSNMQVGQIGQLALDYSIALRVRFEGQPPAQRELYFRGPVLSVFDGRTWEPASVRYAPRVLPAAQLQVQGAPIAYEITLEPTLRPWILVLDAAAQPPALPGFTLSMTSDLLWHTQQAVTEVVRYKVQSHTQFRYGPLQPVPGLQADLELPPGLNPRTIALGAALRSDAGLGTPVARTLSAADTRRLVETVLQRLRSGGYQYTLDPGVSGRHSADEFWFDNKQGFCEHIASAFVILMRSMGVPARIVTGYQGGEANPVDGYWVVRQSDAHAWAEVWLPTQGWVRVDPTGAVAPGRVGTLQRLQAPSGVVANALSSVFGSVSPDTVARLRATWEALNNSWNQWVLNYSQSRQLDLLKDVGFDAPRWEDLIVVLAGLLVSASLAGAAWTLWERRVNDPWLRLLLRARTRLQRLGVSLTPDMTPRQMATLAQQRWGASATRELQAWLLRLEAVRYGAPDSAQRAGTLKDLQSEFQRLPWPPA